MWAARTWTETPPCPLTAEQRLLLLDTWQRSGLPAGDFAPLVGISKHTLPLTGSGHQRSSQKQSGKRALERRVRKRALAFQRWAARQGLGSTEAAA